MPNYSKAGSGLSTTVDLYRESVGKSAENALSAGNGVLCVSGDHTGAGELCVEVINRLKNLGTKKGRNLTENADAYKAVDAIRRGFGHHVAQADHAGSDTCAQTIGKATK